MSDEQAVLREIFSRGYTFSEFVEAVGSRGGAFRRAREAVRLPEDIRDQFARRVERAGGLRFLVMAEGWCPDAVDNVPPLAELADTIDDIELRCHFRENEPRLRHFFSDRGVDRIPAVATLDGEFRPLGVWQERPAEAHRLVDRIKEGRDRGRDTAHLTRRLKQGYRSGDLQRATLEEILSALDSPA